MEFVFDSALDRACKIIFGPEVPVNHHFLHGLKPSRIKTIFRKKALLVHPDRLASVDRRTRERYTRLFIETKWAYDHLRKFCEERDDGKLSIKAKVRARQKPHQTRKRTDSRSRRSRNIKTPQGTRYFNGIMPQRKLLFGEFLFYSQIVPWDAFIKAIFLQRKGRPRFGDIAEHWKYLTEAEVNTIVSGKKFLELIGETSIRMSLMNRFQVEAVLHYQRLVQRPIGEYFIESGHISKPLVETYLGNFQSFNEQFLCRR
jgi:hypothetical protein